MSNSQLLTDLARVRAQFQMEAIMQQFRVDSVAKATGFRIHLPLDNSHKDGVE